MPTTFTTWVSGNLITETWANLVDSSINAVESTQIDGGSSTLSVTLQGIDGWGAT